MVVPWDVGRQQIMNLSYPPAVSSRLRRMATAALSCLLLVLNHRHCCTTK